MGYVIQLHPLEYNPIAKDKKAKMSPCEENYMQETCQQLCLYYIKFNLDLPKQFCSIALSFKCLRVYILESP